MAKVVMLQLGVSRSPDCHILMQWTRVAKDIVPEDLNFSSNNSAPVQHIGTGWVALDAARILTEGDLDAETFEIATKHMSRVFMEITKYKKLKRTK